MKNFHRTHTSFRLTLSHLSTLLNLASAYASARVPPLLGLRLHLCPWLLPLVCAWPPRWLPHLHLHQQLRPRLKLCKQLLRTLHLIPKLLLCLSQDPCNSARLSPLGTSAVLQWHLPPRRLVTDASRCKMSHHSYSSEGWCLRLLLYCCVMTITVVNLCGC